jgi:pyruvate dehydrogenase E1 component
MKHKGQPTAILFQGVKGFGLGTTGAEGRNVAHNQLEMSEEELKAFCKRFNLSLTDKQLAELSFYKPADDSPEMKYLQAQRKKLGGYLPSRHVTSQPLKTPACIYHYDVGTYFKRVIKRHEYCFTYCSDFF